MAIKISPGGQTLVLKLFRTGDPYLVADAAPAAVDGIASPAGVEAVASIGTALATGGAVASPAGVSAVASVGTAVASGSAVAVPSGVAAVASVGSASATGAAVASPLGVEAVSAIGQATADGGPSDGVASPAGVEMVASVGTATAYDADAVPVSGGGVGSWRARRAVQDQGDLRVFVRVFPFGVAATARAGRATATGDARVEVTGVSAQTALGVAQAGADAVTDVVGAPVDSLVGKAAAFDVHVLPVLRYVALETRSVDPPVGLTMASGDPPHEAVEPLAAIDRAWTDLQTEEDELLLLGVIV